MVATEKIEKSLIEVKDKLAQLGIEDQLVAEIEWCLGSYSYDGNPTGLIEKAAVAKEALEKYKKANPKKVPKKLLDTLDSALNEKN